MHDDELEATLIARYLAGECTEEERAAVERRAEHDAAWRAELDAARSLWEDASAVPSSARVDAMWSALHRRLRADAERPMTAPPRRPTHVITLPTRERRYAPWLRAGGAIAATAVLAVGATLLQRAGDRPTTPAPAASAPAPREFATARGQRATLRLVDGTKVELGYASRLRVQAFEGGRRELFLEGEAIFDVVHDPRRPFVVRTALAVTEDLGTRFGVRAYPHDGAVRVVVVHGKVAVRPDHPGVTARAGDTLAILGPGQLARLGPGGRLEVLRHVDADAYLGWASNRVSFHAARLDEIAAELARRFDVEIRIADPSLAARRVTVDMSASSLDDVLEAITVPLGLRHTREGAAVVLER